MDALTQRELERRYASAVSARAAAFVRAADAASALEGIGLLGPDDKLVRVDVDGASCLPDALPAPHRTFWLVESIGAHGLRVPDLRSLATAARESGAFLVVDNTLATWYGCAPLALGAHLSLEALGEGGVVAAAVARSRASRKRPADPLADALFDMLAPLWDEGRASCLSADEAAALSVSFDELPGRMQRAMDSARALAEFLRCHPAVLSVCYPGLPSHPDHAVAANVLVHGFGRRVDFELAGPADAVFSVPGVSRACGDDLRYASVLAGIDDPVNVADSLDQALRMFCNPPEP